MKKMLFTLMGIAVMAAAVSCKKKKDEPAAQVSKMLIGTKWKVSAQTVSPAVDLNGDGQADTDVFALQPACSKDDYLVFSEGGSFQFYEGAVKCTEENHTAGTWVLFNNDKSIRITDEDGTFEAQILSISAGTLSYKFNEEINGQTVTITETRVKS